MKITKSHLKELIRQSVIDEIKEGGPGSGRKPEDETGGPSYANVPKGAKSSKEARKMKKIEKAMMKAADDANKKMDAAEKKKKKESVRESKGKRCTVKEIKKWMKGLEENRYKKTYNSDCRRFSWLVNNNLSEDYESMPVSMRKKWSKAQYGRERFLAKEFIKHLKSQKLAEQKLRKAIRKIIKEELIQEAKSEIVIDLKDLAKVKKIIKKFKGQFVKHPYGKKTFCIKVDKNQYNKALEFLMKNKINPRG